MVNMANYIIEKAAILWWGGFKFTEHTAFLAKNGRSSSLGGSMNLNSKIVAEQIGAQIFTDGWAIVPVNLNWLQIWQSVQQV